MKSSVTFLCFLFLVLFCPNVKAQKYRVDVVHYRFCIALNDSSNRIQGNATLLFKMEHSSGSVAFDLNRFNDATGKGMLVQRVISGGHDVSFLQEPYRIVINLGRMVPRDSSLSVQIVYSGVPADGLVISRNQFKDRTFFADNWPNRAHDWIPCNDFPSDKASVEFLVTAPDHYQVVSNGILVETSDLPNDMKLTHWKEDLPLPTKVMVIGVAPFAVQRLGVVDKVPIWSWVFAENRDSGFAQYAISKKILPFLVSYIGPFPYSKLANVQSKTIFGGMENAGNIFYYENSVRDSATLPPDYQPLEPLFAHETAHQWFGDEATESSFAHLWLSEGFATYMTQLYMENTYGEDTLRSRMARDRDKVIAFYHHHPVAVVDTVHPTDPMLLLNPNSYQKGSWVLHMLRRKLGDLVFQKGIRLYYQTYKGSNASTEDFMHIMERVSRQSLQTFFNQWIFTAGHPVLKGRWTFDPSHKELSVEVSQTQAHIFTFPLQLGIYEKGRSMLKTLSITGKHSQVVFPCPFKPTLVTLDPNVNLLFEGNMKEGK